MINCNNHDCGIPYNSYNENEYLKKCPKCENEISQVIFNMCNYNHKCNCGPKKWFEQYCINCGYRTIIMDSYEFSKIVNLLEIKFNNIKFSNNELKFLKKILNKEINYKIDCWQDCNDNPDTSFEDECVQMIDLYFLENKKLNFNYNYIWIIYCLFDYYIHKLVNDKWGFRLDISNPFLGENIYYLFIIWKKINVFFKRFFLDVDWKYKIFSKLITYNFDILISNVFF